MVTENNSQINTFVKGMNTDTSYLMLDSQAYTFAKNLRINSVSTAEASIGNNRLGEIKPIKGITEYFLDDTAEYFDGQVGTTGLFDKILAAKTIRLYGVIISLTIDNTDSTTQPTYVWRFTNKIGQKDFLDDINSHNIDDLHLVFGPFDGPKNVNNISIDLRYEDDDNIKLYIADSIDPIMVLNIAPEQDAYNTGLAGDKSKIMSYPAILFNPPVFVEMISGNLKPAKVQYSYRLYNKNGVATDISPTTKQIPIIDTVSTNVYTRNTKGVPLDKTSTSGVRIKIKIDSTYSYLTNVIVYRITYAESGLLAAIEQIVDANLDLLYKDSNNYVYINDVGQLALSTLTYEEYNAISGIHIIPRVIESMHDRLFAANIKEVSANSDFIDKINNLDTRAYSADPHGDVHLYNATSGTLEVPAFDINNIPNIPLTNDCYNKYNDISQDYYDVPTGGLQYTSDGEYDRFDADGMYGGTGKYISWKFVYRNIAIDTSTYGVNNETTSNIIRTDSDYILSSVNDVVYSVDMYGTEHGYTIDGTLNNGRIYADPYTSMTFPSLKHNELYRYGIVFYNEYGLAAPVKWIADIRTPRVSYAGWLPFVKDTTGAELSAKSIGILFSIDYQLEGFPLEIVAYEIVRCNRTINDISTVTLGVISRPVVRMSSGDYSFPYTPSGFVTTANMWTGGFYRYGVDGVGLTSTMSAYTDTYDILLLITPEIAYNSDYMKSITLSLPLKINPILYLYPLARESEVSYYTTFELTSIVKPSISNLNIPFSYNTTVSFASPGSGMSDHGVVTIPEYTFFTVNAFMVPMFYVANTTNSRAFSSYDTSDASYIAPGRTNIVNTGSTSPYTLLYSTKKNMYAAVKLYGNSIRIVDGDEPSESLGGHPGNIISLGRTNLDYDIDSIKYPDLLQWNDGYEGDSTGNNSKLYQEHIISIGDKQYVNWVIGGEYDERLFSSDAAAYSLASSAYLFDRDNAKTQGSVLGPGGSCAVIHMGQTPNIIEPNNGYHVGSVQDIDKSSYFGTFLCDIKLKYVLPYGGYTNLARDLNTYYSYGDYHSIVDSSPYIFNGEYYPNVMEYVSMHKFYTPLDKITGSSTMIEYAIPVYSTINLAYTHGNELSKNLDSDYITNLLEEPASVYNVYIQEKPLYVYNAAYSAYSSVKQFAAQSQEVLDEKDDYDYRCFYSNLKINDERIDSWTKFMPANYLDVDTRYGEITHLRNFHNQLVYWQLNATGLFSVNERTAITDNNNMPLILGEGGVLSRYDYIDLTNGMAKDQFCDAQSSHILYWFDDHDLSIRAYTEKSVPLNITKKNYVLSIMNKKSDKNKNPKMFFDHNNGELVANVLKNASIVYNENLDAFTAIYTIPFLHYLQFLNGTYIVDNYLDIPHPELASCLGIALWEDNHDGNLKSWNDAFIDTELEYVVNKSATITKVFDNQEIVSPNIPSKVGKLESITDKSNIDPNAFFSTNHTYSWTTDINNAVDKEVSMTAREGNYRFAISRADNKQYGDRIRGKYMVANIKCSKPLVDASISYIITKFRASWS